MTFHLRLSEALIIGRGGLPYTANAGVLGDIMIVPQRGRYRASSFRSRSVTSFSTEELLNIKMAQLILSVMCA